MKPRAKGVEYDVDERDGTLFIHANDTHENFRVVTAPVTAPGEWTELIPGSQRHYILGVTTFQNLIAETLEKVCVDTVEAGKMTKDLAILIRPDHPFLTTEEFMDAVDAGLKKRMQ